MIYEVKDFLALITITNFRELPELLGSLVNIGEEIVQSCGGFYRSGAYILGLDTFTATH